MAGYFINSRGTTLMVDPLLEGFDMPIMIDFPIAAKDVPRLDAILVTHADNDHYQRSDQSRSEIRHSCLSTPPYMSIR